MNVDDLHLRPASHLIDELDPLRSFNSARIGAQQSNDSAERTGSSDNWSSRIVGELPGHERARQASPLHWKLQ